MVYIDMASMSDDTRERFLDLSGLEALGQIDTYEQVELDQLRRQFMVS